MKKNYVKPELFYESFVLSQHIAGCRLTINNDLQDVNNCTASGTIDLGFGGNTHSAWFTSTNANCEMLSDAYCYTNGTIYSANINS